MFPGKLVLLICHNYPFFLCHFFSLTFTDIYRIIGNKTLKATTWKVIFKLENDVLRGNYTLQLALASAANAEVQVH